MKKILIIVAITTSILFACKSVKIEPKVEAKYEIQGEKVEADLYFNWIRMGNLYNKDVSSRENITSVLDTSKIENMGEDSVFLILYRALNEKNLLYSPYIEVVMENDVYATWYLTAEDYEKIKKYKLKDLNTENKKVHISADLEMINPNAFQCFKILDIELLDKENYKNSDDKFNVEDYK